MALPFLKPREPHKQDLILLLSTDNDALTYDIGGKDWVSIQLVSVDGTAIGTGVATLQLSLDGANFSAFPTGAETINAFGVNDLFVVKGYNYLRIFTSTTQASVRAYVYIVAGVDR